MISATEFPAVADSISPENPPSSIGDLRPAARPAALVSPTKALWNGSDLLLVGLVAVLALVTAITAVRQFQHRQALDRITKDLTTAAKAFQDHMRQHGTAPADSQAGAVPHGMASLLSMIDWAAPTPAGGAYRWVNTSARGSTGATVIGGKIAITAFPPGPPFTLSRDDLLEIDRRIDDGDLTTGNFRTGFNGWPALAVGAAP